MTQNRVLSQNGLGAQGAHLRPRLRAHCAQAERTLRFGRRVVARTGAVSWPPSGHVAAHTGSVASRVAGYAVRYVTGPPITIKKLYRDTSPCRAPCRSTPTPCRRALLSSITTPSAPCRDARPVPPIMIQMIVSRHTLLARPRAHTLLHALARRPTVSWPC